MKFSGKYIILEKDDKGKEMGKEYNGYDKRLIFEGEYLNGKRNGHGIEYNNNKPICESEYLNNKKNGKGKEYNKYGELIFEGEYLNNKRWNGKGKEYDNKEGLIFEGEYLNGIKWNGIGNEIVYTNNMKIIFLIKYKNGLKKDPEMEIYNKYKVLIYKGEHFKGKKNGKGKEYNNCNGFLMFEGEFLNNHKIRGKTYYQNDKVEFEGEFLFDKKWIGKGYDANGNLIYELINGKGKVREFDSYGRLIYVGEYLNGIYNGKGKEYDGSFYLKYEGEYLNGKRNGRGKEYYHGDLIFEGEYLNGKRNGYEKEHNSPKEIIFEGEYLNDIKQLNHHLFLE